ncbi:MAG: hypothetical protein JXR83_12350 [Deltaproteobacteria bacterium]|nr:hypothetical protein [Deltaproteobacteria bacterium]
MTTSMPVNYGVRLALAGLSLLIAVGCEDCDDDNLQIIKEPESQTDLFSQKAAAEVDILWVVDNSESMEAEQRKIADRFADFFTQLINSQVNFHIGIITTDVAEDGKLRQYNGTPVQSCNGCRFITKDVPCPSPDVSYSGLSEAEIEARLLSDCPAQLVFRKLIQVGTDGANYEQGLTTAAMALGAEVDSTGQPLRNVPAENAGFVRDTASLYLIFVSDEQDYSRGPTRYFYRLFEGYKRAGNENKIAISAITGWPVNAAVQMFSACAVLNTGYDSDTGNDDPDLQSALSILDGEAGGCRDPGDSSDLGHAEVGGRFVELACRTNGVLADICSDDYSTALDDLGANAAGLTRKFVVSKPEAIHFGLDCEPFTEDDPFIECGTETADVHAEPLCVIATPLAGGGEQIVKHSANTGYHYEKGTNSVRFDGTFLPAPGTEVRISYKLRPSTLGTCQ